jgi:hypothetical protein
VREVVLLPEMLQAGREALEEGRDRHLSADDLVVSIYLAMRGIEEIAVMHQHNGVVH